MKKIYMYFLVLALILQNAFAAVDLMALQGTVNITGTGNITVTIWNNATGGTLVYNSSSDFNNTVQNGRYDLLLGSRSQILSLEYGKTFYLDIAINNQDLDFSGSERQQFQSSIGNINASRVFGDDAVNSFNAVDNIAIYNNSGTITLNQTWNNNSIDNRVTASFLQNLLNSIYASITNVQEWISSNSTADRSYTDSRVSSLANFTPQTNCTGTDKVVGFWTNGTAICGADQTSSGTGDTSTLEETWKIEQDFCTASASVFDPFLGTAISSGTVTAASGDILHPCVMGLRDSTTSNGGYMLRTDITSFLISGNEKATFVFRQNTARANLTYRMGFFDTATFAEPTDGCYLNINATDMVPIIYNLTGRCRSNNAETRTSTSLGITNLQWYIGYIEVNPTASTVLFTLNDVTGATLWSDSVTSNIPNTAGRETGFGVIATENTTSAAADIVQMDYIKLQIFNRSSISRLAYSSRMPIRMSQEFLTASASVFDPFLGTAASSGTAVAYNGDINHPGIINLTDSTTANGGYRITTDATSFLISGNESATFIFKEPAGYQRFNASALLGFFDTTAINTAPTDGCYLKINSTYLSNTSIWGLCRSSSVESITNTYYNISLDSWVQANISVNPTASSVVFTLQNTSQTLWTDSVSSNIPTAAGRETGFGVIAGEISTDAARTVITMDYMELVVNRGLGR